MERIQIKKYSPPPEKDPEEELIVSECWEAVETIRKATDTLIRISGVLED